MRILTVASFLTFVSLLFAPTAAAGGHEASGDGWRIFVPEGFQAAPPSVCIDLSARVRDLIASAGIPLSGDPSQRQFVSLGPDGEVGNILVIRYRLIQGRALRSVGQLDLEAIRNTLQMTAHDAGDLEVRRVDRARLNAVTEGIRVTVVERGERGSALSEFRFAIVVASGSAVVVVLRATDRAPFDTPETWKRLLTSIRITAPEPGLERLVPVVGGALGLLLLIIVAVFVIRRHRVEPSYAMSIDPTGSGATEGFVDTGSRAADGIALPGEPAMGSSFGLPPAPPPRPPLVAPPVADL